MVEESRLFADQPDCAIIFSWHIADELAPKLRAKGYRGKLVTPLAGAARALTDDLTALVGIGPTAGISLQSLLPLVANSGARA